MKFIALFSLGLLTSWTTLKAAETTPAYEVRTLHGWTVHIRQELLEPSKKDLTEKGLSLIGQQMETIEKVVPGPALVHLKKIPIWVSPPYANARPRAEYHPGADWLKSQGRDPNMVKGVEFTDLENLDKEVLRMPMLTLHELAHGYHDQVLGFNNPEIKAAYEKAKGSGTYDSVARRNWKGVLPKPEKAYAMTNAQEYFAESTEAFFGQNDFFPFTRPELEKHDPTITAILKKVWGAE
jgi:hypothetical protein